MIRRPPRSTLSSSSAASDVYKRQGLLLLYRKLLPDKELRVKDGIQHRQLHSPVKQFASPKDAAWFCSRIATRLRESELRPDIFPVFPGEKDQGANHAFRRVYQVRWHKLHCFQQPLLQEVAVLQFEPPETHL